ncbi:replication-relaxation family protein [Conexibacter sp. CPCC 206217]|uniref:replication-relaxation family protein n=1 Tax=Conexibacter sp. CPCC 206217 TaxID=3064574 RepID=UPI00272671E5|nr:replication-relaxation family protein [Conexibacter sp. CPCC 206217]MDO8213477.1 replication-relaxation family protein [Conexibacter sp. CPCC 206217]
MTTVELLRLADELTLTEREVVETVARFGLMTHAQVAALLPNRDDATPASRARAARRMLARLTKHKVLARLERRVGGVRAGSAGYCYYAGPTGQRLLAYWQGRGLGRGRFRPEPGRQYVRHRLAIAELYVQLHAVDADGGLELLAFDPEPACWRRLVDRMGGETILKPDAFVRLGLGAYEARYMLEVDLGSESRTVIARKLRAYLDYFDSGVEQAEHGVFPLVLLATTTETRRAALVEACTRLPAEAWALFAVTTLDQAVAVMGGLLEADAIDPNGAPS